MYNSQYYTCEQIDERLLQGYLDDYNNQTGQNLNKAQFLTKLRNVFSKIELINSRPTIDSQSLVESGGVHAYNIEYFDKFSFDTLVSGTFINLKRWNHIFPAGAHYSIKLIGASFERGSGSNSSIALALWSNQSPIKSINTDNFNNFRVDGEFVNEVEDLHLALGVDGGDFSNVSGYIYVKIDSDIKHNTFFHKCLNQTIYDGLKELYLNGLSENYEYYFFITRYNGTYYLQLTNQETLNSNTIVAETRIVSSEDAVRTIASINESGVSGYVLFDYTVLDNEPEIDHTLGPCRIRKDNASDFSFCPSISSYLKNVSNDELYLTGIDESTQYYNRLVEWDGRWMYQIFNSPTVSSGALVAQTFIDGVGIQSVIPYNGSTVTGYVYISELVSNDTPKLIDNSYVTNLDNSPKIKDFLLGNTTIVINKNGSGDYTSLLEGLLEATQHMNTKVYVEGFEGVSGEEDGVYNLVKEYKEKYGNSYWDNYNTGDEEDIKLKNRIHVIFAANTIVKFEYQGEGGNQYVHHEFSPFRSGPYGFTLENATIVASNCRYCVHDERNSETDQYTNRYINCTMKLDNSENNPWVWQGNSGDYPDYGYIQCIGGGLGKCGYIEVIGCHFESVIPDTINIRDDERGIVSWHNSSAVGAKSHLIIANNYFVGKTTFRLSWYGASTKKTTALVCGNLFGIDVINKAETSSSSNNNTEIKKWNNEISIITQ